MDKSEGLSKAEREMIVVATSARNDCLYCVVAHGAILRIRAKNPLIADQIAVNYRTSADITPRQRHDASISRLRMCHDAATRSATQDFDAHRRDMAFGPMTMMWDIGGDRRLLRHVEPVGQPDLDATERRVLRHGPLSGPATRTVKTWTC